MGRKAQWPPRMHQHRRSGQARVRVRGKDIYLGPWDSQEAKERYALLIARLVKEPNEPPKPGGLLVGEAATLWLAQEGTRYQGVELDHYQRCVAMLVKHAGRVKCQDFSVSDLERVRQAMIARGWSAGLINRRICRTRTIWRWLELHGHAPRGSWAHLRTLPGLSRADPRVRHLPARKPAEWADVARVCRRAGPAPRAMLLLGWFSGARPSEICRLRPCDIDRTDPEVWLYRPATHKCSWRGRDKVITFGKVCQKVLAPFLADCQPEAFVFVPSARTRVRRRLYYTAQVYGRAVKRACERAGVMLTPYQLRHSFRLRVTRAMGIDAARAAMGHASSSMTERYAAGADVRTAADVARRLG
jgi:integrase